MQDGIWTASSHPLPLFQMDSGNAPDVFLATSYPSQILSTFAFLPPSSILTLINIFHTTLTLYHSCASPGYPFQKKTTTTTTTNIYTYIYNNTSLTTLIPTISFQYNHIPAIPTIDFQ